MQTGKVKAPPAGSGAAGVRTALPVAASQVTVATTPAPASFTSVNVDDVTVAGPTGSLNAARTDDVVAAGAVLPSAGATLVTAGGVVSTVQARRAGVGSAPP